MSRVIIREFSPRAIDDFLSFFDHDAFSDNPEWDDCYCGLYQIEDQGRSDTSRADRRREMAKLVAEGRVDGLIAYDDNKPVAWCKAGPRENYPFLGRVLKLSLSPPERVGSIICFVVAPSHRGKGIASELLSAACEALRRKGLEFAEAYPVKAPESAADNFHGPLSMYTKAGFKQIHDAGTYTVVRRPLQPQ